MTRLLTVACSLTAFLVATPAAASRDRQLPRPGTQSSPPPVGQRIVARDGDTVLIEDDARVRIVRRHEARVRLIYNGTQHWLVVLADFVAPNGIDGRVDVHYTFNNLAGEWPFEARWEGDATIEEYSVPGEVGRGAFALAMPQGVVQLIGQPGSSWLQDPNATAVLTFRGSGQGNDGRTSFDEAEQRQVAIASRNAEQQAQLPSGFSSSMGMSVTGGAAGGGVVTSGEQAPVRVGGTIRQPAKLVDVKPVYPPTALRAGVSGVVILEITIDTDGSVQQARVLRGIPMLDAAAVEAARQWRFEPTLLNGNPVRVIMTVTVPFLDQ